MSGLRGTRTPGPVIQSSLGFVLEHLSRFAQVRQFVRKYETILYVKMANNLTTKSTHEISRRGLVEIEPADSENSA